MKSGGALEKLSGKSVRVASVSVVIEHHQGAPVTESVG
jgi:hypothetical protein